MASVSILSSSPEMNGTTLSIMSSEATPGYPAPLRACIVVTITCFRPNCISGFNVIAN